jgi:23S rRNA (cytidine1920-2'-O)/16S rRNA (cytidine1409-2'-O)-methyltransferase
MDNDSKHRLDQHLVNLKLAESRSKAQALIKARKVFSHGKALTKPKHPWVSRGGMKLAHAIEHFCLASLIQSTYCLDLGASTGGFTDVLLQHGATHVDAVDVGTGQLHPSLLNNSNVNNIEQTNAKDLTADHLTAAPTIIVCDASFISLKKLLPAPLTLTAPNAQLITLIKPQFEVGKERADKHKGVIKNEKMHQRICDDISHWLMELGWCVQGVTLSPITGPKGNKEFLLYAKRG